MYTDYNTQFINLWYFIANYKKNKVIDIIMISLRK